MFHQEASVETIKMIPCTFLLNDIAVKKLFVVFVNTCTENCGLNTPHFLYCKYPKQIVSDIYGENCEVQFEHVLCAFSKKYIICLRSWPI